MPTPSELHEETQITIEESDRILTLEWSGAIEMIPITSIARVSWHEDLGVTIHQRGVPEMRIPYPFASIEVAEEIREIWARVTSS